MVFGFWTFTDCWQNWKTTDIKLFLIWNFDWKKYCFDPWKKTKYGSDFEFISWYKITNEWAFMILMTQSWKFGPSFLFKTFFFTIVFKTTVRLNFIFQIFGSWRKILYFVNPCFFLIVFSKTTVPGKVVEFSSTTLISNWGLKLLIVSIVLSAVMFT